MATVANHGETDHKMPRDNRSHDPPRTLLPRVSPFLYRGFNWYIRRYLHRNFNAVRVSKQTAPIVPANDAVVCFANHPSWWDPLIAFMLNQTFMDGRTAYAPIDQAALDKYPVFRKLGFYGIDLESRRGAKQFLSVTRELLKQPTSAIWMTPGGEFADVRSRTEFRPGLSHIAAHATNVSLVPMALEYSFWEQRRAEVLVEFGAPIRVQEVEHSKDEWQDVLENALAATQASLATKSLTRDASHFFEVGLTGTGLGRLFDFLGDATFIVTGKRFDRRHLRQPTGSRLNA